MIGSQIAHYLIQEKLGEGGMGVVYKAEDTKLKRIVALKFLPPHLTRDQEANDRFIQEAQAASSLDHQNICTIHEINETKPAPADAGDGQMYIVMTYYEGETLKEKIKRGQLEIDEAINIAVQIAKGLAKAHQKGVVHRDIKPANIMITPDGVVKILDFGLAKLAGTTRITKNGTTLGTVAYMSAEQAFGKDVDFRTDIWSLGVVLYEMITGQLPFKGEFEQAVLYSIMNEEPEPISEVREEIPNEVEQVVLKTLTKIPDERYQAAAEVLSDLKKIQKAFQTDDSIQLSISKHKKSTGKGVKKLILAAGIFIIFVVAFIVVKNLFFFKISETNPVSIAIIPFENLTGDPAHDNLRRIIPNLLITSLEQSRYLRVTTWERLHQLLKQFEKAAKEVINIDKDTGYELCRQANIPVIVTGSYAKVGDYFTIEAKVLDVNSLKLLKGANAKGNGINSILESQIDEISVEIAKGFDIADGHIKKMQRPIQDITTTSIEAYNNFIIGKELQYRVRSKEARKYLKRCISIDSTFAIAYLYLALDRDYQTAKSKAEYYKLAKLYSLNAPEKYRLHIEAVYIWRVEKKLEKAILIFEKLVELYPNEPDYYFDLAVCLNRQKRYSDAMKRCEKVLELAPDDGRVYNQLGWIFYGQNKLDKAIKALRKYASLSPGDANPYDSMAEIYFRSGEIDSAIVYWENAKKTQPEWILFNLISYCYALKENYDRAIEWSAPKDERFGLLRPLYSALYHYFTGAEETALSDLKPITQISDSAAKIKNSGYTAKYWAERLKASIYYDLGEYNLSKSAMKKWVNYRKSKNPSGLYDFFFHRHFGFIHVKQGQIDSARSYLNLLSHKNPFDEYYYNMLYGEILFAEDSLDKAIQVYPQKSPFEINNNDLLAPFIFNYHFSKDLRAKAYIKRGDLEKAISEYENLIIIKPEVDCRLIYPKYHYRLAKLYEKVGKKNKAIEQYEKFLEIWKNADEDLPELIDAKKRLSNLKG